MTAVVLPLLGVPFLGDRGALYRAMGVLTAGATVVYVLVPTTWCSSCLVVAAESGTC